MNQFNNPYMNMNQKPLIYPPQNGIIWVQGIEGAKAYQLQPSSNAILMDSESDNRFYIKVSDNVGMCTLRTFEYHELSNLPTNDMTEYVKKSDLRAEVENLVNSMLGGNAHESTVQTTKSNKLITQ